MTAIPPSASADATVSLIFIGPRPAETLTALLPEKLASLVLVEPNPDRAVALGAAKTGRKVIVAAVGAKAERADLVEFNFPGLRSIHKPSTELRQLLPGLNERSRRSVDVITSAQLLERCGAMPRPLHLWIDAPQRIPLA